MRPKLTQNCLVVRYANHDTTYKTHIYIYKYIGSKVWTIVRVTNCLDAHLGKIVCDKDGVVDWCIVLLEMQLTRFEECWPLPTESLPKLP